MLTAGQNCQLSKFNFIACLFYSLEGLSWSRIPWHSLTDKSIDAKASRRAVAQVCCTKLWFCATGRSLCVRRRLGIEYREKHPKTLITFATSVRVVVSLQQCMASYAQTVSITKVKAE